MFQSLGLSHPRYTPVIKKFAADFFLDPDCRIHFRTRRRPDRSGEVNDGIEVENARQDRSSSDGIGIGLT